MRPARLNGGGLPWSGSRCLTVCPNTGAGVLFIVKNYEGDVMNFTMAAEMAGREVASVVTNDDVAVEKSTYTTGRRGVAGTLIVEKMVGCSGAHRGTALGCLIKSLLLAREATEETSISSVSPPRPQPAPALPRRALPAARRRR